MTALAATITRDRARRAFAAALLMAMLALGLSSVEPPAAMAHRPGHCGHHDYPNGRWYSKFVGVAGDDRGRHWHYYGHFFDGEPQHTEEVRCHHPHHRDW